MCTSGKKNMLLKLVLGCFFWGGDKGSGTLTEKIQCNGLVYQMPTFIKGTLCIAYGFDN